MPRGASSWLRAGSERMRQQLASQLGAAYPQAELASAAAER